MTDNLQQLITGTFFLQRNKEIRMPHKKDDLPYHVKLNATDKQSAIKEARKLESIGGYLSFYNLFRHDGTGDPPEFCAAFLRKEAE